MKQHWEDRQRSYKGAPPYGMEWGGEPILGTISNLCKPYIEGRTVLEIGCGGGKWTKVLYDRMNAKQVIACDVHPVAIIDTTAYEPRATTIEYKGDSLQNLPESDVVFTYDVLLHLPQSLVFRYIKDSMSRGGIILALPLIDSKHGRHLINYYAENKVFEQPFDKGYMEFYSKSMIEAMADIAGGQAIFLDLVEDRDALYYIKPKDL